MVKQTNKNNDLLDSEYYFSEINPNISKSFTYEQEEEIKTILKRAVKIPTKKIVNLNSSFWFIKRFYITLYIGFDKRYSNREYDNNRTMRILNFIFRLLLILFAIFLVCVFLFCILYTLKSALGIDIFKSKHLRDILNSMAKTL
jgi:hypothetical protein